MDTGKNKEAMNSGEENTSGKEPDRVVVTYYTVWVDENGRLNFREDIYGHDEKLAQKMFN
jgi:murein L,D-transpeptidase YcbB/YkuD